MSFNAVTLTRDAYTQIGDGENDTFFSNGIGKVFLPAIPFRLGHRDSAEIVFGDDTVPTVPDNIEAPHPEAFVLNNPASGVYPSGNLAIQIYLDEDARLYARWLGQHEYADPEDMYVVVRA